MIKYLSFTSFLLWGLSDLTAHAQQDSLEGGYEIRRSVCESASGLVKIRQKNRELLVIEKFELYQGSHYHSHIKEGLFEPLIDDDVIFFKHGISKDHRHLQEFIFYTLPNNHIYLDLLNPQEGPNEPQYGGTFSYKGEKFNISFLVEKLSNGFATTYTLYINNPSYALPPAAEVESIKNMAKKFGSTDLVLPLPHTPTERFILSKKESS